MPVACMPMQSTSTQTTLLKTGKYCWGEIQDRWIRIQRQMFDLRKKSSSDLHSKFRGRPVSTRERPDLAGYFSLQCIGGTRPFGVPLVSSRVPSETEPANPCSHGIFSKNAQRSYRSLRGYHRRRSTCCPSSWSLILWPCSLPERTEPCSVYKWVSYS